MWPGDNPPRLVGRLAHLRALRQARAVSADAGLVRVAVTGGPGVGRSALLDEFVGACRQEGGFAVRVRCRLADRQVPTALVTDLLRCLAEEVSPISDARQSTCQTRPPLLGWQPTGTDDWADRDRQVSAARAAVAALTERGPLVVAVDDITYAGRPALQWLRQVLEACARLPILLLVSIRAGEPPTAPEHLAEMLTDATWMELDGLTEAETGDLLCTLLPSRPAGRFVAEVHRWCGGSPYMIGELAQVLRSRSAGSGLPHSVDEVVLHDALRLVRGRLNRLGTALMRIVETIAVAQSHGGVDAALVAHLTGLDVHEVLTALDLLIRMRLIGDAESLPLRHPALGTAIAASMTAMARSATHLSIAEYLFVLNAPADRIASHLTASTVAPSGSWPVQVLLQAADHARETGADGVEGRCLELAARVATGTQHREAMLRLAHLEIRRDPENGLLAAVAVLSEDNDRAVVAGMLGQIGRVLYETELGAHHHDLLDRIDTSVRGTVFEGWAEGYQKLHRPFLGRPAQVRRRIQGLLSPPDAMAVLEGDDTDRRPVQTAWSALDAFLRYLVDSDPREAVREARQALGQDGTGLQLHPLARTAALAVLADAGDHHEATSWLNRFERSESEGRSSPKGWLASVRGRIALAVGDLEEAGRCLNDALWEPGERPEAPHDPITVILVGLLADVHVSRGEPDDARTLLRRYRLIDELPPGWHYSELLLARARMRAGDGDLTGARRDLADLRARAYQAGIRLPGSLMWRRYGADLLVAVGRRRQAVRVACAQLKFADAVGSPLERGRALRAQACASGTAEKHRLLREAVALLSPAESLDAAHALADLGSALSGSLTRQEAITALTQAVHIADRCAAGALALRSRQQLLVAHERAPRQMSLRGVLTLTRRERQILIDAIRGATNNGIAQTRHITRRTVELHLSSAYRKLGITGRIDLPQLFRDPAFWPLLADGLPARGRPTN